MAKGGLLSIVIPVFNEEDNLPVLFERIRKQADELDRPWELVLVDDGSSDGSGRIMHELKTRDERVRFVRLSRNFGQQVAICAGLDAARGELIMMMDADLQDPPEQIPRFVDEIEQGYDLVFGIRSGRKDPLITRAMSKVFWGTLRWLTGFELPRNLAVMRIFNRRFLTEFQRFPERQKFIEGLFMWIGLRRKAIEIPHGPRHAGQSKYNLWRKLTLATTAITSFSDRPLTIAVGVGTVLALLGAAVLGVIVLMKLTVGYFAQGWVSLFGIVLLSGGIQLFFLGVLGKYIGRLFNEAKQRPLYVVRETSEALEMDAQKGLQEASSPRIAMSSVSEASRSQSDAE